MSSKIPLLGSERQHPSHSVYVGQPAPSEPIQVTMVLNRKRSVPESAVFEQHLCHADLAAQYGADPAAIRAVEEFASEHHLSISHSDPAARTVTLCGTVSQMEAAFGVALELRGVGAATYRVRNGVIHVPDTLRNDVLAVLGLDNRPAAKTYSSIQPRNQTESVSYTPPQLAKLYNFPLNTGKNQTIAIIELGGGFKNTDLKKYWQTLGLPGVSVTSVSVGGAKNSPTGDPNGPDGEVVLDIEVAGGVAPGAHLAVYFAPNTDEGFLNAITAAIHDKVRRPSVISISWGAAESQWTPQAMNAFNAAFHDAALLGITVCIASGDNGSSDGVVDGADYVDFPASSPWALACGGTNLLASNGKIVSETVWNDGTDAGASGGGVSTHFSRPAYQDGCNVPPPRSTSNSTGRGVPDVSAVGDPATGYAVLVDGTPLVAGGTSAVAPLWAGLVALLNEQLGKNLGWFHPALYGAIAKNKALNDVVSGNNGDFTAQPGWDACTGLGSPNGQAILNVLKSPSTK